MKKTFRDKLISKFTHIAHKHKLLRYPCLVILTIILGGYHFLRHFAMNTKRYASVVFVIIFFMTSCSFSFAVFAEKTGFIKAQETYSAVVEDSDIALAVETETPVGEQFYEGSVDDLSYNNEEGDVTGADAYSLDDLLESQADYALAREGQTEGGQADDGQTEAADGYEFDSSDWRLVLINKQHPIPENYEFNLGTIRGGMQCDERIIEDLLLMMQAARNDGVNLLVKSPYRTMSRQENNFNDRIKVYMRQGMSYMDAYKETSRIITVPGSSEHQVGLALDIACDTYPYLEQPFGDTEAGQWLAEHSCEYGFTLRYPSGKEYITSIEYEPWHFRYVGREAATIMRDEGICLEEFWDKYL